MNSVVDLREPIHITGRWITEAEFARLHGLNRQTLTNWRYIDRKAGRTEAGTGYPVYPYFGRAIRYWLETPEQSLPLAA